MMMMMIMSSATKQFLVPQHGLGSKQTHWPTFMALQLQLVCGWGLKVESSYLFFVEWMAPS